MQDAIKDLTAMQVDEEQTKKTNRMVIMWIVLFPPLGLVRIWTKSTWRRSIKVFMTLLVVAYLGLVVFSVWYPLYKVEKELGFR
jgi:hypothetical protein